MNIKQEGLIIVAIIITVYLAAVPLTLHFSNTYVYDDITFAYKEIKGISGYNITNIYSFTIAGNIDFHETNKAITINNTPVKITKFNHGGTIFFGGTITEKPTKINIHTITLSKHTPLTTPPAIVFVILSVISIIGLTRISEYPQTKLIKARKIFIITTIILAAALFSAISTNTYHSYNFQKFSFTDNGKIYIVENTTITTQVPFTAKILPLGTVISLELTAPNNTTYTAYYYESIGYLFTADKLHKSIWIDGTTAPLGNKIYISWKIAGIYTLLFIIFFIGTLFAYSQFISDILEPNNKS